MLQDWGVPSDASYDGLHCHFEADQECDDDDFYGASIPLHLAMYAMTQALHKKQSSYLSAHSQGQINPRSPRLQDERRDSLRRAWRPSPSLPTRRHWRPERQVGSTYLDQIGGELVLLSEERLYVAKRSFPHHRG